MLVLDCTIKPSYGWRTRPNALGEANHLRKFSLHCTPRRSDNTFKSSLHHVIEAFIGSAGLSDLEELRLATVDEEVEITTVLRLLLTTKKLRRLYFTSNDERELDSRSARANRDSAPTIVMPHLHTLVISNGSVLEFFKVPNLVCFESDSIPPGHSQFPDSLASKLEALTVPGWFLCAWNDILTQYSKERHGLWNLKMLRVTPGQVQIQPKAPLKFSNLRYISFKEDIDNHRSRKRIIGDSLLNHFLLEMLYSPENCPHLHTIATTTYPNWALAIGVFHRRNSDKGVSPISSFRLCGQPQVVILSLVSRAIEAAASSSQDIISAAVEVDRSLHKRWALRFFQEQACQECIMAGYVTCVTTGEQKKRKDPPENPEIEGLLSLDYSPTPVNQAVALTRDDWLAHLHNTTISSDYAMRRPCSRHNEKDMFHIGSNTLDGITFDNF